MQEGKKLLLILAALVVVLLAGCGEGDVSTVEYTSFVFCVYDTSYTTDITDGEVVTKRIITISTVLLTNNYSRTLERFDKDNMDYSLGMAFPVIDEEKTVDVLHCTMEFPND